MAEDDPLAGGRRKFEEVDDPNDRGYQPPMPANVGKLERSCYLVSDPKMRELRHYVQSHRHEGRLRSAAELEQRCNSPKGPVGAPSSPAAAAGAAAQNDDDDDGDDEKNSKKKCPLRTEGRDAVDRHMKRLATEKATVPKMGSNGDTSDAFRILGQNNRKTDFDINLAERRAMLQRMDRFHTRLQWRNHMDHSLRKLLVDMDLARDDRLKTAQHNLRCDHLDKVFDWYKSHGKKESRKEKESPPYVRYITDDPVMPGSLRVARHAWKKEATRGGQGGLGTSSSSPALLAGGAAISGGAGGAPGGEDASPAAEE